MYIRTCAYTGTLASHHCCGPFTLVSKGDIFFFSIEHVQHEAAVDFRIVRPPTAFITGMFYIRATLSFEG